MITIFSLKPSKAIYLLLMVLFVCLFGNVASAQTNTWDGSSSNNWNTAANWSLNIVPTAAHNVVIPNVATKPTISVSGAVCATLNINNTGGNTNTLLITSPGTLVVSGAITMTGPTGGTRNTIINVSNGNLTASSILMIQSGNDSRDCQLLISSGNANISGNITMTTDTDRGSIVFSGAGTLNVGGTITGGTLTPSTGTVNYNNTGSQTIGSYTYNNLTISGSGTKTFGAATTINGNLSIASGAVANLGVFTHTAGNLSLGGLVASSGTWGSTTSSATYTNNTYYDATTGIVNIGTSSCSSPIVYSITGSGNFCAGSAGNLIGLSDSDIGVSYQLIRNRVNVGSVVAGTGNSISFGLHNSAGEYKVVATRNSTFCSATMTGEVTISSLPPTPVGVTTIDTSCSASTGSITLANQNHGLEFVKTTSQYISTTTPFLSNLNTFTMEGWIKYRTSDLNVGFTSLFGQNDVIEFGFQGGQLHLYTENGGNIYATPPANLGDNTWHHIAAVGTGSQILIYVDGVVAGSGGSVTGNYGSHTDNVNIGAGVFNPTGDFFAGQIMKVGFYNTALSGTRIASLAYSPINYAGTETGLIAGYNFLEGSGATLTSLPAGRNGTLVNTPAWKDPYTYSWTKTGTPAYTATTRDITGLSPGTYNLSFDIGKGCSRTVSYTVGTLEATWNGTSWSSSPTVNHNLIFNGNYLPAVNPKVDINGCSCTVNTGRDVTINSGHNLILSGDLTVLGTLTFENNASLVQTNNAAVNSGDIIYKRQTSSVRNTDYTYWSSPVASHSLAISTSYGGGMFYSFNDFAIPEAWLEESSSSNMIVGKGYIIRGPEIISSSPPPPPGNYLATFIGKPNNGIKNIAIGPTGTSNLLGNPYPSAIYADQFLYDNRFVVEGTIYFWSHKTAIQLASNLPAGTAGSGAFAYTSDDYASYNLTGPVGTGSGTVSPSGSDKPNGYIAAGQGFFTTSIDTGASVTFNNAMRVSGTTASGNTGKNEQFFKTKKTKEKLNNTVEKNRVWLNLTNAQGAFKQTLVGYVSGATNEYDTLFDGKTFDGNEFIDFYSINQEKNLVIQGRALPFDENDQVPLGYHSKIDSEFIINIDETDGKLANQPIFIEDKLTNTVFDLKKGNYTFKTVAGTFNDRFVLRYTDKTLSTAENELTKNKIIVSVKKKQIKIDSFAETIDKISIYDGAGRQIYQKDNVNSNVLTIPNLFSSHQILIVKTTLENGKVVSDKIVY